MKKIFLILMLLLFITPAFAADFNEQKFLRNYAQILVVGRGNLFHESDIHTAAGKIYQIDGKYVSYRDGKISHIDYVSVNYDPYGRIDRIGNDWIEYDNKGRIRWLGNKSIDYDLCDNVLYVD